jgi:hypothetical protein
LFVPFLFLNMIFAEQKVQERVPGKTKGAFLLAGRQSKKALFSFFQAFWVQPIPRDLGLAPPYQQRAGFLAESSTSTAAFPEHAFQ